MPIDDLSFAEIKAFDATARCGSMSAAARQLGCRQPTVSGHIASLEKRYGVELFHRLGRRLELTDVGTLLHEVSHRMCRAEADAAALLLGARSQYVGRLQIAAIGPYNVTPLLTRFRERHPAVKIAVSVGDSRRIVERIGRYEGDVGVVLHAVDDPRYVCMPYRRQALVVFAQRGHALAQRGSLALRDLENQEFVMREEGSTTRRVFEQALSAAGVRIRATLEMGSREGVREAVAQGLGLGVVADTAYLDTPRLCRLPLADTALHTHPHLICLAERRQAPLINSFFEVAQQHRDALAATTRAGNSGT
jgi:aminoethylphosphonate catabolism LysR family transcriptional regulator